MLATLLPAALAAPARAEPEPGASHAEAEIPDELRAARRVVVDRFHGAGAENVRSGAVAALEEEDAVDVVAVQLLEAQAPTLDGSAESYVELSRRLNLSAVVRGKVKRLTTEPKKPFLATLTVINGLDGQPIGKVTFSAGSVAALRTRLATSLWAELEPLIRRCSSAKQPASTPATTRAEGGKSQPEPEPEMSASAAKPESSGSHDKPIPKGDEIRVSPPVERTGHRRFPILQVGASVGSLQRTFDYRDEERGALRAYLLHSAPIARLDAAFYPFALSSRGAVGGLGLRGGFEPLLQVTSRLAQRRLATRAYAYHAELVWRLPLGPFAFEPALGFAERRYEVSENVVPAVAYRSLLMNLGAELRAAWFVAEVAGGGRFVLGTGQLGSAAWFPNASALGWDAKAQLGVAIGDWLDLLLGGEAVLYRLDFHTSSSATGPGTFPNGVAAGASDRYLQALFSVRFRLAKGRPSE